MSYDSELDREEDPDDAVALERRTALGAFEFAKTRYARSLTAESDAKFMASYAVERTSLAHEVANFRILARSRHDAAWAAAQRYATKAPHRVGKNGFVSPTTLDRANNFGIDKFYRNAKKAAAELDEVNELLRKRLKSLAELDREIARTIELRTRAARRQLETPDGFSMAMRRDPLFERAYKRVKALGPFAIPPAAAEANARDDVAAQDAGIPQESDVEATTTS